MAKTDQTTTPKPPAPAADGDRIEDVSGKPDTTKPREPEAGSAAHAAQQSAATTAAREAALAAQRDTTTKD